MKFEKAKELFEKYDVGWKDHHVYEHGIRVMNYAIKVCEALKSLPGVRLNLDRDYRMAIRFAAMYHDIGEILWAPEMLMENRKLTKKDLEIYEKHPQVGYDILKTYYSNGPVTQFISSLVLHHHEKIDGSGFPKGLKAEKIPLGARIITVCDAYDAMFKHYSQKTEEEAIQELKKFRGKHFDEEVIDAFLKMLEQEKSNSF